MEVFRREDVPLIIDTGNVQIRAREVGGMMMVFYRFAKGADLHPALHGLPGDACTCPHWGYVLSGKLRIHTVDGAREVAAGQAFYVEPGHYPEALADTEMVELSPSQELRVVGEHILRAAAAHYRPATMA
ncbi:MAG TPA: hypothetical protein VFQ53_35760 [Kofleriaceae bacterium]|nr:hypothetical protein [Kofleriaceae bacterium]